MIAPPAGRITDARLAYIKEDARVQGFMVFLLNGALGLMDKVIEATGGSETMTPEALAKLRYASSGKYPSPDELLYRFHDPLLTEMLAARAVDNYLVYVGDILAMIFKTRPEMLRSGEQERLDFILRFESMEELRIALAQKRVDKLSYKGLRDLQKDLHTHVGIELFQDEARLEQAVEYNEVRNVLVHARGIVSPASAKRAPSLVQYLHQRIPLTYDNAKEYRKFFEGAVEDFDLRAIEKFGLPYRSPISKPKDKVADDASSGPMLDNA